MRILVLGLNYAPENIGVGLYTSGLCRHLIEAGHSVRVISAKPYYPQWQVPKAYRGGWKRSTEHGVDITRCPIYVPANPSGAKRLLHHLSFAASALFPMLKAAAGFRPDLVFTTAPSILAAPLAWVAARSSGSQCWLHVQDFEMEAAFATGLLDGEGRGARVARDVERRIVRGFDHLSSISPEMCRKLQGFGIAAGRITEFRNWADINAIRPFSGVSPYRDEWNITTPHVALYSGNIANKQGIEIVVDAARRLAHRDDLSFVICGQGPNRAALAKRAAGLTNVHFHDLQPTERLHELLGMATIHLLPQKAGAADLVLPSKLTNMLASGRPSVVTAAPDTGLAREVEGTGIVTPPEDVAALADAIETLMDDETRYVGYAAEARRRAEQRWDRSTILAAVTETMREAAGSGKRKRLLRGSQIA